WNAKLRGPSQRIDSRRALPYAIPRVVVVHVVDENPVDLDAARIAAHAEGVPAIVPRVELDEDPVRGGLIIPARIRRDYRSRRVVEGAHGDVHRLVVKGERRDRAERRVGTGSGPLLHEIGCGGSRIGEGVPPDRVIQASIDRWS